MTPKIVCRLLVWLVFFFVSSVAESGAHGDDPFSLTLGLYAQTLSRADGDRCVMHPSCRTYAQQAILRFGGFRGWIMTCDRLMRCGRDEIRRVFPVMINGQKRFPDPVAECFGSTPGLFENYVWPERMHTEEP
ncbi:MAG: hypothetical protein CSA22_04580 [Deltaproteobacteria bacterium]|nr:MAG: hypothetical protein CSA22_04580 [Deltaproteobacteria bacterium]